MATTIPARAPLMPRGGGEVYEVVHEEIVTFGQFR